MQVSKKIPFDDPTVLMAVRISYVVSNLIIFAIYFYIQTKINAKKGTCGFLRPNQDMCLTSSRCLDLTTIKYVEPAPMGSGEDPKLVTTTVQEYDNSQLRALYKAQLMGVGMMAVMHLYFKYTNPLLIQSIIPLKGAFEGNLVKVHLFGTPATGELKRPWKAAGGFPGMPAAEIKSDKASIEAAEKSGRGGVKDE